MKKFIMLVGILMSLSSAAAFAYDSGDFDSFRRGAEFYEPRLNGYPVDATPTDWRGEPYESVYSAVRRAADLFCRYQGFRYSSYADHSTYGAYRGTMRMTPYGGVQYCRECEWTLSRVTCSGR